MAFCSEVNRCFEEAKNFHSSFIGQTQAAQAHLLALQQVRHKKKKVTMYLARKYYYFGDTIFTSPCGDETAILRGLLSHTKV